MRFYFIPESYSAQIEGSALVGLRFGYTALGLAFWPPKHRRRPWWQPHFRLAFWSHTGQCNHRWIVLVQVGRKQFGFLTRGETSPGHYRYGDAGWWFGRRSSASIRSH